MVLCAFVWYGHIPRSLFREHIDRNLLQHACDKMMTYVQTELVMTTGAASIGARCVGTASL